jgi:hypothetical protein
VIGAPAVGAIGAIFGPRYGLLVGGLAAVGIGAVAFALRTSAPDQPRAVEVPVQSIPAPSAAG